MMVPRQLDGRTKIAPQVQTELDSLAQNEMMTVIVTLVDQADTSQISGTGWAVQQKAVINALRNMADATQKPIRDLLEARGAQGKVDQINTFWLFNGLSVMATADVINELAARADVVSITTDSVALIPASQPTMSLLPNNLAVINAPALWERGYYGQGVVVASMDTGVDMSHPDLAASWRGGSNSWFDPYGEHPTTPTDMDGHGTWTMGVMVGGAANGSPIGVAPQAQWIAVKIFNDKGMTTATAIHQGFQWLLDPDGDPDTADAPQIVNSSWDNGNPGCNPEFQRDLQALRAAGIMPVFAAGNYGPDGASSASPANYPEALSVGAVDSVDEMYTFSSRGPVNCGGGPVVFPKLVAPGVDIFTTERHGLYYQATSTSLAAPHVSGGLALLLSAFPYLTPDEQEKVLLDTAVDLGTPGPDNAFGYGRIDILAAYQWLENTQ
ncbi:MAG: S8 family serine peptidase [Ardenticatenaceae bacterium]|nr:S8 family serine peptidase [Ardenticatenaceae bacterium]MCB9445209.1 S8 family serine peptidase [Ardenticatenaceae bacterium]